jgi:hypothetical protein
MPQTTKTWAALKNELSEALRKWNVTTWSIDPDKPDRKLTTKYLDRDARAVTLTFRRWNVITNSVGLFKITMRNRVTLVDNLHALAQAIEHLRIAEYREIDKILITIYQQMDPQQRPQPAPQSPPHLPEHYRVLGVQPTAPMVVVEAAYKALTKVYHPDVGGGDLIKMQRLNAAMDEVRKERAG